MGKFIGRMLGIFLFAGFISGGFCPFQSLSKAAETAVFSYITSRGKQGETDRFMDAFDMCRKYGGTMTIQRDYHLNPEDYDDFVYIPENVMIVISNGVCFRLGDLELWLEGTIEVMGTFDVSDSEAMVSGGGNLVTIGEGSFKRRTPYIDKIGEICLQGTDIESGQPLSQSVIRDHQIYWRADVSGVWSFSQQEKIPETGTGVYDVTFTPANLWVYQPVTFYSCGQITVRKKVVSSAPIPGPDAGIHGSEENGSQSQQKSADAEKDIGTTIVITRMVSKPSSIFRAAKKFSEKKPGIQTIKRKKKRQRLYIKWTTIAGKKGYELQYTTFRSMKKAKKTKTKKNSVTIHISKNKTYYFRIRAYKENNKKRTYTKWSSIKKG